MNNDERVNELRKRKAHVVFKEEHPKFYNSWRSFRHTEKGKKIGNSLEWNSFEKFYEDMHETYFDGARLVRLDKSKNFCKENCKWCTDEESAMLKESTILITYNGETLTMKEWAIKAETTTSAISNRYYKHPEYTPEEWIYGKKKIRKDKAVKDWRESESGIRSKASKMISAYKCKDKKLGLTNCDITIDWMIENIILQPCKYCGDVERIGCDRIDNDKGHTMDNVVPCCYDCNCARNNNFTYEEMLELGKTIHKIKENRKLNNG